MSQPTGKLEEAIAILKARGVKPIQWKHLPYEAVLAMAGVTP